MPLPTRPRRLAAVVAGLTVAGVAAALVASASADKPAPAPPPAKPVAAAEPTPLFAKTEPAANRPALVLLPDGDRIQGWVAGDKSFAGEEAAVIVRSSVTRVRVRDDNTFTFTCPIKLDSPQTAEVRLAAGGVKLVSSVLLTPQPDSPGESIFFVTDRSAYRPGHTLKFAAYLRTLRADGEFEPVRGRDVTIDLTSEAKRTRAARLKLKSDDFGRVTGSYTFSDADSLDHYRLTCDGFAGDARVMLGEYRKSKVGLKIKGEVKDGKLLLTFDARDFLDRPVKGLDASFTAQVSRQTDAFAKTLKPEAFAHPDPAPPSADVIDQLPADERLLSLAHGVSAMTFAGLGARVVAYREGKVGFGSDGPGRVALDLNPDWLKGHHTVTVTGVLTDETGRDNRATATINLDPTDSRGVRVTVPKELIAAGEKLPVTVEPFGLGEKDAPVTTLVVVRLDPNPNSPWGSPVFDPEGDELPDNTRLPAIESPKRGKKPAAEGWRPFPVFDPVRRRVQTVLPVAGGKADADLRQPGAYKLLAVTRLADGTVLQGEAGVVVKSPAKLPGLVLKLDDREVQSGARLRGVVHTRFAGTRMLLTLRDSTGVRLTKVLTASPAGVAKFDEPLPANLRYGCAVTVQYPESASVVHAEQRELFVVPNDRTIAVTTKGPETVGPGAEVKLDISVNRSEPVDLIVSVFDESLLGVSGDLSGSIRDFYLADARGQNKAARELAAQRVGSVRVAGLVAKAEKLLKDPDALAAQPGLQPVLTRLVQRHKEGSLALGDVATLVRLAGLEVYISDPYSYGGSPAIPVGQDARLGDLLGHRPGPSDADQHYVSAVSVGNVVMVALASRNGGDPWAALRSGGYGLYGFGGWGQFGALGGQFGIGGFGGGGLYGYGFGRGVLFEAHVRENRVYPGQFAPGGQMGMSFGFNRDFALSGNSVYSYAGGQAAFSALPVAAGPMPPIGGASDVVRRDFADSAFWSANLRTDEHGKATATFKVPDSLTNWRVVVTAVSARMHVGAGVSKFKTTRPVMVWPMLPRAFTAGDTVSIFGTVHNLTDKPQEVRVRCAAENGTVLSAPEATVTVPANGNVPVYWTYKAGKTGWTDILMSADSAAGKDASLKRLPVTRAGIVERETAAGLVGKGDLKLTLPPEFDRSSAMVQVTVAPTLAADMADTLPYLVEYPYGCVEQTMSRFLPAVKVEQILQRSGIRLPELEKKLPKVVEAGVKRLLDLQLADGGWGWQGTSQTHEMMTPYALYGLLEAEKAGYTIPNENAVNAGINRLKGFLEAMKPAWAAFDPRARQQPNPQQFPPTQINDSLYCLWVLSYREKVPDDWWPRIEGAAGSKQMSDYGHALALELAARAGRRPLADKLAAELGQRAQKAGEGVHWRSGNFSRWMDNPFEVTAAVLKALVARDPHDPLIPGILAYFESTKRGDRWDSTKDTAVVLYALCDYLAAAKAGPAAAGDVTLSVNGGPAKRLTLDGPLSKTVTLPADGLKPGANTITVRAGKGTDGALARAVVKFTRGDGDVPARDHGVSVARTVSVRGKDGRWTDLRSGAAVAKGSYVRVRVTAKAGDSAALQYALAESPKPACGETVPADDRRFADALTAGGYVLREDREAMTCFHYEYAAGELTADYVFLTEFAGEFRLPPARVELMYRPASGGHSDSFTLKVE